MLSNIKNTLSKLAYLRDKIDTYRIYNYKDFKFYNAEVFKTFEIYQKKLHAYRENPQNILHFDMRTHTFHANKLDSTTTEHKPLIFELKTQSNQNQNAQAPEDIFKDYEAKVQDEIDNLPKDSHTFARFEKFANSDCIKLTSYNLNIAQKILRVIFSFKIFSKNICVLSPDSIFATTAHIQRQESAKPYFTESLCLLNAKKIPPNSQHKYYLQKLDKDNLTFQIFCVPKSVLNDFSMQMTKSLYFLNPLEIFSALYSFYPALSHYTLILQGITHHALCHYIYGHLSFAVVLQKDSPLQDYFKDIKNLGEIFYCDYSNDRLFVGDFKNIESCFNMPLDNCLKILSFKYLQDKGLKSSFFADDVWNLRTFLKVVLSASFLLILCLILNICYKYYAQHAFINEQNEIYKQNLQKQKAKKESYTPVYDQIYEHIQNKKSLNFRIKNDKE